MPIKGNDGVGKVLSSFVAESLFHFACDFRLFFWVRHAGEEIGPAAIECAFGNQLADTGARGGVSILILGNIEAFTARLLDAGEHFIRLPPSRWPGKFDVRNLSANVRLASDAEDFVESLVNLRIFITHMARIDAVIR